MVFTRPSFGAIARINWRFLWAFLWGWLSFASWPLAGLHWGFIIISVIAGLICWGLVRRNLKVIANHLRQDREVRKFNRKGHAPRSDRMADRAALKQGGMLR